MRNVTQKGLGCWKGRRALIQGRVRIQPLSGARRLPKQQRARGPARQPPLARRS